MLWDAEPALPDKTAATGYRDSPWWPRTGLPAASFRRLMIKVDAHKTASTSTAQKFSQTRHHNPLGKLRDGHRRGTPIPGQRFEMTPDARRGRFARHHCVF